MSKIFLLSVVGLMVIFCWNPSRGQETSGPELVKRLNCMACHALGGKGGNRGPGWDGLGQRLSPEAIKKQIVSPQGRMPNFAHLKPEELTALVEYLSSL